MTRESSGEAALEMPVTRLEAGASIESDSVPVHLPPTEAASLPVQVKVDADGRISLSGSATIHHAALLHRQLSRIDLERFEHVALDLSELGGLDSAGAQILIALRRACRATSVHSCPGSGAAFSRADWFDCLTNGRGSA